MDTMSPIHLGEGFYRSVKQGVLQFVLIKPITSLLALFLAGWNKYDEGDFSLNSGYFYCSFINNVSVSISLYYLVLLYTVTKDNLDKSILYKFLCVKSLVFFSYWQSCVFGVLIRMGTFGEAEEAAVISVRFQNLLLCFELAVASYYFWKSFGIKEFMVKQRREYSVIKSVGDMLNVKDIITDAHSTFTGSVEILDYSEYTWED